MLSEAARGTAAPGTAPTSALLAYALGREPVAALAMPRPVELDPDIRPGRANARGLLGGRRSDRGGETGRQEREARPPAHALPIRMALEQ